MSGLLGSIMSLFGGNPLSQLSKVIGADDSKTQGGIAAALPMMLGALTRNTSNPEGAEALSNSLSKDHDGGILDNLSDFLSKGDTTPGTGILKHVFGSKQSHLQNAVSKSSGLDSAASGKLMSLLAPVLMGALGKQQKQNGFNSQSLTGFLGQEQEAAEKAEPAAMGQVSKLLDQDGDGDVDLQDLAKMGMGKLFG